MGFLQREDAKQYRFIQRTNLLAANALLALSRSLSSEAFWLRRSSCVASVKCCKVAWIWSDLFATDGEDSVKAINLSKNLSQNDNKTFGLLQQCTPLPVQGWGISLLFDWQHKESLQYTGFNAKYIFNSEKLI